MDGQGILLNTFQNYYNKKSNLVSKVAVCSNYPPPAPVVDPHTDHLPSCGCFPTPPVRKTTKTQLKTSRLFRVRSRLLPRH